MSDQSNNTAEPKSAPEHISDMRYPLAAVAAIFVVGAYLAVKPVQHELKDIQSAALTADNQFVSAKILKLVYSTNRSERLLPLINMDDVIADTAEACFNQTVSSKPAIDSYQDPKSLKPWVAAAVKTCLANLVRKLPGSLEVDELTFGEAKFSDQFVNQVESLQHESGDSDIKAEILTMDNQRVGVTIHDLKYSTYRYERSLINMDDAIIKAAQHCAIMPLSSKLAIDAYQDPTSFKPWVGDAFKICLTEAFRGLPGDLQLDGFALEAKFPAEVVNQVESRQQDQERLRQAQERLRQAQERLRQLQEQPKQ